VHELLVFLRLLLYNLTHLLCSHCLFSTTQVNMIQALSCELNTLVHDDRFSAYTFLLFSTTSSNVSEKGQDASKRLARNT
jgi:hypothetical protein